MSKYPTDTYKECPPYLEIQYERPKEVTYDGMGAKYCLTMMPSLKWKVRPLSRFDPKHFLAFTLPQEFTADSEGKITSKSLKDVTISSLPFQCGLTFKETENHMFSTGSLPFVVSVVFE